MTKITISLLNVTLFSLLFTSPVYAEEIRTGRTTGTVLNSGKITSGEISDQQATSPQAAAQKQSASSASKNSGINGALDGLNIFKKKNKHHEPYRPYLESTRELQIPQWENENWYVEDWTSQRSGKDLVKGFYDADIIRGQDVTKNNIPVLTVGPNFYRLSGLDKRRVTQTIDTVYGMTASRENGSFMLKDWHTNQYIGAFDKNGLRLN